MIRIICMLITILVSFSSCSQAGLSNDNRLRVSFVSMEQARSISSRVLLSELHTFDRSMYRIPYSTNTQGELVQRATPTNFISSILPIILATPNSSQLISESSDVMFGEASGIGLIPSYDMCYAKSIIDLPLSQLEADTASRIEFGAFSRSMPADSADNFPMLSELCIDLGDDYSFTVFSNEIAEKKIGTFHFFHLADLIPLEGNQNTYSVLIEFQTGIDKPLILNPDGSYASFTPDLGVSGNNMGLGGYVLYLPGATVDLSSGKELIFSWELNNLIEIYDNNTPDDRSDDLATLRLDNPFPISFYSADSESDSVVADGKDPSDVHYFDIRTWQDYYDGSVVVLRWVNPSITDYSKTIVVRKEGQAPSTLEDGEIVYSGRAPIFKDTTVEAGKSYYYLVVVEDAEGYRSEGQRINIISN